MAASKPFTPIDWHTVDMFRRKDAPAGARFQLKEKIFSIGDDSWILDGDGDRIFKVNGKALRIRRTLVIEPRGGGELYKIQERKLHIKDTMVIETPGARRRQRSRRS